MLAGPADGGPGRRRGDLAASLTWLLLGGLVAGAVVGSYGGARGEQLWQVLFAALKVPLPLALTPLLCLPSYYVAHALLGLRRDFPRAAAAVLQGQGAVALTLAALSPYAALFYLSGGSYRAALLFDALLFALASAGGQLRLRALLRPLLERRPRHRLLLRGWLIAYALVGIQMAWVLRPFLGAPGAPVRFVRPEAWGNAYLVVCRLVRQTLWP